MSRALKLIACTTVLIMGAGLQAGGLRPPSEQDPAQAPDVVYVGTPYDVVAKMLRMARLRQEDIVYDLGCGDGRTLVLAAAKYGCRGRGYDIDPERVGAARANAERSGVADLVKISEADFFAIDISEADALFLYLLPGLNLRLLLKFETLKAGSRLVFHDYGLEGIQEDEAIQVVSNEDNASHTIFLYTTPLKSTKQ